MRGHRVLTSRLSTEWETPPELFSALNDRHQFTLDVCATPDNTKCRRFFTKRDDGLSKSWAGERVWLNPPYGRQIGDWVAKATEEECLAVCLIPSRTDTRWWHDSVMEHASDIQFLRGRVRFVGAQSGAPFPSAVVTFGRPP